MIKAIIFDLDGVISDTQKLHSKIESELLSRYGIQISPQEITKKYSGVRTKDFFRKVLKNKIRADNLDSMLDQKWHQMKKAASQSVDQIDGSVDLIKRLNKKNYPLAVVSSSNLDYVKTVLKTLDLLEYFRCVIGGDMVLKGKPDPEGFLLASSRINVNPENCLVIEDGISGMIAANRAKMKCIGLVKDLNQSYPVKNIITSLSEITQEYLDQTCENIY